MKKAFEIILCLLFALSLCGCESKPKCEHVNTTTAYVIDVFSIKKTVTCNDCQKELSKDSISKLRYVYDKVLLEDNGIKCTLLDIEVDVLGSLTMHFEIEGTGSKKRTFESTKMFLNGYDASIWLYCSDLSGNHKSLESSWITGVEGQDFINKQDFKVEFGYSIVDSSSYKKLSEKTVKFNLNEYKSLEEVE
ncbi:MAG: hypothetical protein II126_01825 [Erysipelotrichaceae bacterium]|nr:hypothetical protein [Erysipelotrichaceae bacterium]